MKEYYRRYPHAGYGAFFHHWARSEDSRPYNSWGNGAAMRISPVGFAYDTLEDVLEQAEYFTAITHNHPEGIKGAQATAAAVFLARKGSSKEEIKAAIESLFGYDLSMSLDEIRPTYAFDVSCQGTVPQAITAFLESEGFRGCNPKGRITGRRQRHACLHHGRHCPCLLRPSPGAHHQEGIQHPG